MVVFGDAEVPGESGKKLKLRPPASPEDGGDDLADLTELVPLEQEANLQRFDERHSIRMRSRAAFFQVDVCQDRNGSLMSNVCLWTAFIQPHTPFMSS